jgi:DNA-3-methyladenine glycosylase II
MAGTTSLRSTGGDALRPRGPFSLQQALQFLNGFAPAGAAPQQARYVAAHVVNGRPVLFRLGQEPDGALHLEIQGPDLAQPDLAAAETLVRRVFALDYDGDAFYERVGQADPVLGALQQRFYGLRPVLFGSPFEALCWAVIGQRIAIPQAARLKARLAGRFGPVVVVDGERFQAFPAPEGLLALDPREDGAALGLPALKLERLRGLAERGARGEFGAERLLAMPVAQARAWLEQSPGIGPWASEFTLIRGAGHPDLLPRGERRLLTAVQRYYGLRAEPTFAAVERLSERWAGFRSWAAFLLRVALQADTQEI